MGVPVEATATTADAFSGLSIVVETEWGFTSLIVPNRGFVNGSVSGPNKPSPRNPLSYRSARSVKPFPPRSADERCMQPGSLMTPNIMEAAHLIWQSSCENFSLVVYRLGLAAPGLSSQPSPPIGTKPSSPLAPHFPRRASKPPDGISGREES